MTTSRINVRRTTAPRYANRPAEPAAKAPSRGRTSSPAAIGRAAREALSSMISNVMLTAGDAIEAKCPIRTGHLLSNFIFSTGAPHQGVEGSPEAVSYAAQDAGREKLLNYDVGRDGRVFFTNHVEYLKYQRPFVTQSLMAGVAAAPRGQRGRVRSALKSMAKSAFRRGA